MPSLPGSHTSKQAPPRPECWVSKLCTMPTLQLPCCRGRATSLAVEEASFVKVAVQLDQNVFLGMDRRVAIELGTSLPIKQSPIVNHQKQFPDFVIGRWMYRSDNQYLVNDVGASSSYSTNAEATREYQGPRDRVVYHQLMPQNKVQTLRVKLFARIRDFDADSEVYSIRTIALPTETIDWWHARLHFVSKD